MDKYTDALLLVVENDRCKAEARATKYREALLLVHSAMQRGEPQWFPQSLRSIVEEALATPQTSTATPTCGPEDYKPREDCQTHPWCLVHRRWAAECQPPEVATPETQTSGETPTCGKE